MKLYFLALDGHTSFRHLRHTLVGWRGRNGRYDYRSCKSRRAADDDRPSSVLLFHLLSMLHVRVPRTVWLELVQMKEILPEETRVPPLSAPSLQCACVAWKVHFLMNQRAHKPA